MCRIRADKQLLAPEEVTLLITENSSAVSHNKEMSQEKASNLSLQDFSTPCFSHKMFLEKFNTFGLWNVKSSKGKPEIHMPFTRI